MPEDYSRKGISLGCGNSRTGGRLSVPSNGKVMDGERRVRNKGPAGETCEGLRRRLPVLTTNNFWAGAGGVRGAFLFSTPVGCMNSMKKSDSKVPRGSERLLKAARVCFTPLGCINSIKKSDSKSPGVAIDY